MNRKQTTKLKDFAHALVNQEKAQVIVPAQDTSEGFWFGGGNMIADSKGALYVCGRYRNFGDSRTGTASGTRGLELAIFKSSDKGNSFTKVKSFLKEDLNINNWNVLSIEGTSLNVTDSGIELFISTEKLNRPFPKDFETFQKPGTGSWTIELMSGVDVESLGNSDYKTVLETNDPRWFNIKDPFTATTSHGDLILGYCTHPFNWSSSNTGYVIRKKGATDFSEQNNRFFPRGFCWDIGITRGTALLNVPKIGVFEDTSCTLFFYDGGEALRNYEPHKNAVVRPRGYSCEELGGIAYLSGESMESVERLSVTLPDFISPWGTGCSRYVDVLETKDGFYTTWQQSQKDKSQPLVMNFLSRENAERILS